MAEDESGGEVTGDVWDDSRDDVEHDGCDVEVVVDACSEKAGLLVFQF